MSREHDTASGGDFIAWRNKRDRRFWLVVCPPGFKCVLMRAVMDDFGNLVRVEEA